MPIRPQELTRVSPLARIAAALITLAEYGPALHGPFDAVPMYDVVRELPMAVHAHTVGLRNTWLRHVAYPLLWAQREMDQGRGNPGEEHMQDAARRAIHILEHHCVDTALAKQCADWIRLNHHV